MQEVLGAMTDVQRMLVSTGIGALLALAVRAYGWLWANLKDRKERENRARVRRGEDHLLRAQRNGLTQDWGRET